MKKFLKVLFIIVVVGLVAWLLTSFINKNSTISAPYATRLSDGVNPGDPVPRPAGEEEVEWDLVPSFERG